jgi:hypothetical protein
MSLRRDPSPSHNHVTGVFFFESTLHILRLFFTETTPYNNITFFTGRLGGTWINAHLIPFSFGCPPYIWLDEGGRVDVERENWKGWELDSTGNSNADSRIIIKLVSVGDTSFAM